MYLICILIGLSNEIGLTSPSERSFLFDAISILNSSTDAFPFISILFLWQTFKVFLKAMVLLCTSIPPSTITKGYSMLCSCNKKMN